MKFLQKQPHSPIEEENLSYEIQSDRKHIRAFLLEEQYGFCAYSERYIDPIDSCDIEHFDPRIKGTPQDGHQNWYATLSWINQHKPKHIAPYLPLLSPTSQELSARICYQQGLFVPTSPNDREAENLIEFLGFNKEEVVEARHRHVERVRQLRKLCLDEEQFIEILEQDRSHMSFVSALEVELGIDLWESIEGWKAA